MRSDAGTPDPPRAGVVPRQLAAQLVLAQVQDAQLAGEARDVLGQRAYLVLVHLKGLERPAQEHREGRREPFFAIWLRPKMPEAHEVSVTSTG